MFFSSTQPDNRKLKKHWKVSVVLPRHTNNTTIRQMLVYFFCRNRPITIINIKICIELLLAPVAGAIANCFMVRLIQYYFSIYVQRLKLIINAHYVDYQYFSYF